MNEDLVLLFKDAYNEGYTCGISEEVWFKAFALASIKIYEGEKYREDLVFECYKEIKSRE
jgi:hypothetical protein